MGAFMDKKFVELQTAKNNEFNKFKIDMKSKIIERMVTTQQDIKMKVQQKKEEMLEDLKTNVNPIKAVDLNTYYKCKLMQNLTGRLDDLEYDVVQG